MEVENVFCLRLQKRISSSACSAIVCALATSADLRCCLRCPRGQELAESCPFDDRRRAARHATQNAEECLRATLRYVVPRYAQDKSFSLRFLQVVAGNRCGWTGRAETLARAASAVGLTVRERPWAVVRDKALTDFIF